jgi:hypothetical protein
MLVPPPLLAAGNIRRRIHLSTVKLRGRARGHRPYQLSTVYLHPKLSRVETPVTGFTPSAFSHRRVT